MSDSGVVVTNETLDALCDLLEKRAGSCDRLAKQHRDPLEEIRINGKASGVRLAISFIRDLQRESCHDRRCRTVLVSVPRESFLPRRPCGTMLRCRHGRGHRGVPQGAEGGPTWMRSWVCSCSASSACSPGWPLGRTRARRRVSVVGDDPIEVVSGAGYTQGEFTRMTNLTDVQKNAIHQYRDRFVGLLEDSSSFWNQQVNNDPGTFTLKLMKDAARQLQAGRSLHSMGSFHSTNAKVRAIPRCDRFGTDFTTVDRMANPYRPGTVPHRDWMMAWVDAQYHWKTDRYQQHHAEVTEARDAMIESCAPVANWVDEVLFEVAEAREECEDVDDPMPIMRLDEWGWEDDVAIKVIDNWHVHLTVRAPMPKDSIINISVV